MVPTYAAIAARIAATGLLLRGGFHPESTDRIPPRSDGGIARTVILIGNAGPDLWARFRPFLSTYQGLAHPLNRWVEQTVAPLAVALDATALYTHHGPPFHPFVTWAQRTEPVHPSPIGLLIHPQYGLWHAYRAALLFAASIELPARATQPAPCKTCAQRPCLPARISGVDAARRACPAGREFAYGDGQAAFHQGSFRL